MKKVKLFFLLALFALTANNVNAQKIEMKDNIIKVDGKDFLSYKNPKSNRFEFTIYKLNTEEELLFIIFYTNQTPSYSDDDYLKLNFTGLHLKMESSKAYPWKYTIKWLIESKIFNANGDLDTEKVNAFIDKYNEQLSDKK